jgi:hypothetical protein
MTDAIDIYRQMHGDNMHHSVLTAIESVIRERGLATQCLNDAIRRENHYAKRAQRNEIALGQIAGGDFKDNGLAACSIARNALALHDQMQP